METGDEALARSVMADWRGAALDERQKAILLFTEKLTLRPGDMVEEDHWPLRQVGLDDMAIHDLVQVVSYFNYINRIADGLGVDLEAFMDPRE